MSEPRYIEVEGDKPKVEPTRRYFSALLADTREAERRLLSRRRLGSFYLNDVRALIAELDRLREALVLTKLAYAQACMNLAVVRPSGIDGATVFDDAKHYHDALLAGWGGIQGWDDKEMP